MNPAKCEALDYIDFLVATPHAYSCTEAGRVQPQQTHAPAHDAFTRLLHRLEPDGETLWREAQSQMEPTHGMLVVDDTTLDKPYARKIELVSRHWSGKHRQVVQGINLVSLLWTDGDRPIPCDYRIYHKDSEGATKNDHFRALLHTAHARGFQPACVSFDSWYSSLDNLKLMRSYEWLWLTRLKSNRLVSLNFGGNRPVADQAIAESGTILHLKGYGLINVFKVVTPDGDSEYWATNDLRMSDLVRLKFAEWAWQIEHYHRGLKQYCGVERCQAQTARAQRNHIALALRAFLRLEQFSFVKGVSWFETKTAIIREAVRLYLAHPTCTLTVTA